MSNSRLSTPFILSSCLLSFFIASNAQNFNSYDFVIGDFNNDGRDDYVKRRTGDWATNDAQGNAELYLAQEDGQFTGSRLPQEFDLRTNDINLYVGDFNGDGIDDILRQETGDWAPDHINTAYLLLANGNGSFTKNVLPEDLMIGGDVVEHLWIGDFNADGRDDILRQEKDTSSSPGVTNFLLSVPISPYFVALSPTPAIDLSSQTPQGTFASRQVSAVVGNFNGDQNDDIIKFLSVTGMQYEGTVYLTQFYAGTVEVVNISNQLGYSAHFFVGDFNGDGKDDFVQGGNYLDQGQGKLLISNGDGSFDGTTLSEDLKLDVDGVQIGDFNGDGNSDIFSLGDTVQIYLSKGNDFDIIDTPFSSQGNVGSEFYLGDFNADNKTDILEYTGGENGTVVTHLSNGDGTFSE